MPATLPISRPRKRAPVDAQPETTAEPVIFRRLARDSGLSQPQYLGNTTDVAKINAAMRAAERGDVGSCSRCSGT